MRKLLFCAASAALIFAARAADTAAAKKQAPAATRKTAPAKPATARPQAAKAGVPKSGAVHSATAKGGTSKAGVSKTVASKTGAKTGPARRSSAVANRRPVTTWRTRQAAPSPDRYKEIQDALVAKGYLQPEEATGSWGESSMEAMKRFQAEQKLDSTGKINSLSLIALGLGPKYDSAASSKPAEAPSGQR